MQMTAIPLVQSLAAGSAVSSAERGRLGRIWGVSLAPISAAHLAVATATVTRPRCRDSPSATLGASQGSGTS